MKTSLFTVLVAMTVLNVACEKARTPGRPARGGKAPANGAGMTGKPQLTNLHKPKECPPDLGGEYKLGESDQTLKVTNDGGIIRLTFKDEVVPSVIDGKAYFTDERAQGDKQTYVGICSDQKLIYSIESGPAVGNPNRKTEIEIYPLKDGTTPLAVRVKTSKIDGQKAFTEVQESDFYLHPFTTRTEY